VQSPGTQYQPVKGKTYSLFGDQLSTTPYFDLTSIIVDELLQKTSPEELLKLVRSSARKNNLVNTLIPWRQKDGILDGIDKEQGERLKKHTHEVKEHLKGINIFESYKSVIWTTQKQYYLYMLEIELTNRLYIKSFLSKPYRLALLPHCLRDVWDQCKAEFHEIDQQCRHCNRECYLNQTSRLMVKYDIEPFIWTTRNIKKLFKYIVSKHPDIGVLRIACVPELIMGMRRSTKKGIPAVGIPLNANNCIRWVGDYRQNSLDLNQLSKLLSSP
jgi:hypothetical protein